MLTQTQFTDLSIAKRSVQVLPSDTDQIRCDSGSIWVTQDGDTEDIILQSGERFLPQPRRRVVVYGLEASMATLRRQMPVDVTPRNAREHSARSLILE